jgi:hypothetical protein
MSLTGQLIEYKPDEFIPINQSEFKGLYSINDKGLIKNRKNIVIAQRLHPSGYVQVKLSLNGYVGQYSVHRLMLLTFRPIDNPDLYEGHHIDRIKSNNFITNLKWKTLGDHKIEHKNDCLNLVYKLIEQHGFEKIYKYLLDYE